MQQGFDWAPSPVASRLKTWPSEIQNLAPSWRAVIDQFLESPGGQQLSARLTQALAQGQVIYPPEPLRALSLTTPEDVRVVILGQDPYHGPGQAEGLAFSVAAGVKVPPSLRNIFKELQRSLGLPAPVDGSLIRWARQGVLLLNTCLTVQDGLAASHARWGWELLTDQLVALVAGGPRPVVFMLWGGHAQTKKALFKPAWRARGIWFWRPTTPLPCRHCDRRYLFGLRPFQAGQCVFGRKRSKTIDWMKKFGSPTAHREAETAKAHRG